MSVVDFVLWVALAVYLLAVLITGVAAVVGVVWLLAAATRRAVRAVVQLTRRYGPRLAMAAALAAPTRKD